MNRLNNMRSSFEARPEIERDTHRSLDLGYSIDDSYNLLKCIEHGAPHPLIRWHHHEEYELHLITSTNGKMFVGDYIGDFSPGNLVLLGPYLPHNWVSNDLPEKGVSSRDISLQFLDDPLRKACEFLPEMRQILPLLDDAKNGIEFFGISDFAKQQLLKIKKRKGIRSFNEFLVLMSKLSTHSDYKLLSNVQLKKRTPENIDKYSEVIDYINKNYSSRFTMTEIAERAGMDSSYFSRGFSEATGCTFTDFVNHIRINKACQLLTETDKYISTICYNIGYNTVANFNRRFVEIKKVTPSEYRKLSRSNYQSH